MSSSFKYDGARLFRHFNLLRNNNNNNNNNNNKIIIIIIIIIIMSTIFDNKFFIYPDKTDQLIIKKFTCINR